MKTEFQDTQDAYVFAATMVKEEEALKQPSHSICKIVESIRKIVISLSQTDESSSAIN